MNKFLVSGVCKKDKNKSWDMVLGTYNDRLTMEDINDVVLTQNEQGVEDPVIFMIYKLEV